MRIFRSWLIFGCCLAATYGAAASWACADDQCPAGESLSCTGHYGACVCEAPDPYSGWHGSPGGPGPERPGARDNGDPFSDPACYDNGDPYSGEPNERCDDGYTEFCKKVGTYGGGICVCCPG